MIAPGTSPKDKRALQLAIIAAFFQPGSAAHIAQAFSTGGQRLRAADVQKIWNEAKARGDLPKVVRPHGGPKGTAKARRSA